MKGLLVIGHGSRAAEAKEVFEEVVSGLGDRFGDRVVEGCFMEISNPQIPETVELLYSRGVRELVVLPYFLFPGVHILSDIPEILRECADSHGGLKIEMAKPIGYHSKLIDILKERAEGETECI